MIFITLNYFFNKNLCYSFNSLIVPTLTIITEVMRFINLLSKILSQCKRKRNCECVVSNGPSLTLWSIEEKGMILNCVRVTAMPMMAVPSWRSTCCCASSSSSSSVSTINTDQLRSQLDHLHSEADATRAKGTLLNLPISIIVLVHSYFILSYFLYLNQPCFLDNTHYSQSHEYD